MSIGEYKRLIVITGASRGIGAGLAIECNKKYSDGTLFLLIARNKDKLEEVKKKLIQEENQSNDFRLVTIDFANGKLNSSDYKILLQNSIKDIKLEGIEELIVFYNHGTLSVLSIEESSSVIDEFYQINVIGVWKFLNAVLELFPAHLIRKQFHINMSSKCIEMSNPKLSLYISARAARAKLFECLASKKTELRVLNYQPGSVYTDMSEQLYVATVFGKEFNDDYDNAKHLTPKQTSQKILEIIQDNKFESGSSVDYYD